MLSPRDENRELLAISVFYLARVLESLFFQIFVGGRQDAPLVKIAPSVQEKPEFPPYVEKHLEL